MALLKFAAPLSPSHVETASQTFMLANDAQDAASGRERMLVICCICCTHRSAASEKVPISLPSPAEQGGHEQASNGTSACGLIGREGDHAAQLRSKTAIADSSRQPSFTPQGFGEKRA